MKTISHVGEVSARASVERGFAIDTTFVLFFLALELGQSFAGFRLDSVFLILALLVIAIMPYFLPAGEKPNFSNWLIGRALIAGFAISLGWMFKQSLGTVLPEAFRFMPMTLLIVTAMLSCYIQFYGFLKLREVK
jgi:hypothetical protein